MTHALIIGGTGMLSEVSLYLLERYNFVTICSRRPEKLQIPKSLKARANLQALDYRETERIGELLEESTTLYGQFELVVTWIHDIAPEAPYSIACSNALRRGCRYFHIVGSEYGSPSSRSKENIARFGKLGHIDYSQVILGFVLEKQSSRWLTHKEINSGVVAAIENPARRSVVGTVEPWESRP